jgi:hypothetical protein
LNQLKTVFRNTGTNLTVSGTTTGSATNVTVNGLTAARYADNTFAVAGVPLTNANNTFTAVAQDSYGRTDTNIVSVKLSGNWKCYSDTNGNLTSDGERGRAFDYDDENQCRTFSIMSNGCPRSPLRPIACPVR